MPRPDASAPPEAIRIEDEVWQEAFTRREPAKPRRLQAIDGGRRSPAPAAARRMTGPSSPVSPAASGTVVEPAAPRTAVPRAAAPRTAAARRQREPATGGAIPVSEKLPAATELAGRQQTPSPAAVGGVPGRRTVTIRGYGAERDLPWEATRRRPPRRAYERAGFQPDRVAMWAVLLGVLLVVVAVASAHG